MGSGFALPVENRGARVQREDHGQVQSDLPMPPGGLPHGQAQSSLPVPPGGSPHGHGQSGLPVGGCHPAASGPGSPCRYDVSLMRDMRLRSDLKRAVLDGYAFPLGLAPGPEMTPPKAGFTVEYTSGEGEEPDTYVYHIVISHEKLRPLLRRAFTLLPSEVTAILEIGSRDAYRSVDVFLGAAPISQSSFLDSWSQYETFLVEDGTIAAGANSDEPFVEIFMDQWKRVAIHVPLTMTKEADAIIKEFGLKESTKTWPDLPDDGINMPLQVRPVLLLEDEFSPDVDEVLLQLRHIWSLELNVDPMDNRDDAGRALGLTLWHAVIIVSGADEDDPEAGAYVSVWATAGSLAQMEELIDEALDDYPQWRFETIYTIDRVAYDERPDELADLPPRRNEPQVHLVKIDEWAKVESGGAGGAGGPGGAGGADADDGDG